MSDENFHFTELQRSLRAVAADLRGRAQRLENFISAVEEASERDGLDDFLDPRMAFSGNVLMALSDAGRVQQFSQHEQGAVAALFRMYGEQYDKATKTN
jgi:hypothetical protein